MAIPYTQSKLVEMLDITDLEELKVWVMKNGDAVRIEHLRKTHIINILDLIEKKQFWRQEYKPVLKAELKRRKELHLIKKGKAGRILYAKS